MDHRFDSMPYQRIFLKLQISSETYDMHYMDKIIFYQMYPDCKSCHFSKEYTAQGVDCLTVSTI